MGSPDGSPLVDAGSPEQWLSLNGRANQQGQRLPKEDVDTVECSSRGTSTGVKLSELDDNADPVV